MSASLNSKYPSKLYPFRPQRYHGWDVAEVSPRVVLELPKIGIQTFPIINFSEQGLCFQGPAEPLPLKVGEILEGLKALFGNQTLIYTKAKLKHITLDKTSGLRHYGLKFLENQLNLTKVFELREVYQDHLNPTLRLQQIQRAPRQGQEVLEKLEIESYFEWQGRKISTKIENVSEFGFCFSFNGMLELELFLGTQLQVGTILEKFCFFVDGNCLFSGRLQIIHRHKEETRLRLGTFCLDGQSVSISGLETALRLRGVKKTFLDFLEKTDESEEIRPEFKIALNDFHHFLKAMKSYLENAEASLQKLEDEKERAEALNAVLSFSEGILAERLRDLTLKIEKVVTQFTKEEDERHRKYFQAQVLELTNASLIFRRAFEKPLGYAGDYEMIDIIYRRTQEGRNLWERTISSCFHKYCDSANAVRNRANYLKDKITKVVRENHQQEAIRILSLACGPCEEVLRYLQAEIETQPTTPSDLYFYLVDQEEQALNYAQKRLYPEASRLCSQNRKIKLNFLKQGVKHFLTNAELMAAYPKMDLIYSAGLFDYLPLPIVKQLTEALLAMLSENGRLIIGNFKKGYENAFFMEYTSDWFLKLRTPEELLEFLPNEDWKTRAYIEEEEAGVNLFLNVQKSHDQEQGPT